MRQVPEDASSPGYCAGMDGRVERAAIVALFRDRRSGWLEVADRVERAGSAVAVLEAAADGQDAQASLFDVVSGTAAAVDRAAAEIEQWAGAGIRLVTILDDEYPAQLLTIHQRPPFLLYRGVLEEGDASGVAIVGTRQASESGLATASAIATGLAERGVTVVSGLAAGIDTAAQTAALRAGGRTVAVIGTGLDRAYPAANASLQAQIAADHLVLSQFWPDAAPSKTSFPMRNAVMSGYAAATVVIEASWRSGARMQARLALEHGRPLFLHESLLLHDWARDYRARGAVVVTSATDVLSALDERLNPQVELVWA